MNLFLKDNFLFNKYYLLLLVVFIFPQWASSQDKIKNKETFLEAESYFLYEEFSEALPLYIKLKDQFPENHYLDYRIGRCYISLPYEKKKSIEYLEQASNHISETWKEGNFKENNAPLDVLFYLGDAYRINNQLEKAIKTYKNFKSKINNKIYDVVLVEDQIKSCERALIAERSPVDFNEKNLGEIINTRFSDTNPVVSANEDILVYTSKLPFYQAVYFCTKVNGKWGAPINIIPDLGVDGDCYPTSISSDGRELYFYRSNEFKGDLYVSNFVNGKWSKIRRLNDHINTKYWESHASVSADGKSLYFTSNRKGGFGGLDIYKSIRSSGDNWGPPVNLGPVVNSVYNEESPFISFDSKKLFFSSFGHNTIGGYDVFYSTFKSDGNWTEPVNLGYPVNTPDDDVFFLPLRDGIIGYTAKYDNEGFGRFDLLRYDIFNEKNPRKFLVKGTVKIPFTWSDFSGVRISIYDKTRKDTIFRELLTKEQFSFEAIKGNYEIHLAGPGLKNEILFLTLSQTTKNKEITVNSVMNLMPSQMLVSNSTNSTTQNIISNTSTPQIEKTSVLPVDSGTSNYVKYDSAKLKDNSEKTLSGRSDVVANEKKIVTQKRFLASSYILFSGFAAIIFIIFIVIIKRKKKEKPK